MLRILIADGTPAAMQAERETFGIPPNASLFEAALRAQQPDIQCSSINVADGQDLPGGVALGDFDGLIPACACGTGRLRNHRDGHTT